jgi:hypothetical protein
VEEVLCHGLAEGIITTTGVLMTDKTGWSSPIGSGARLSKRQHGA